MVVFWLLLAGTGAWILGTLVFVYHAVNFRYPRDIIPSMLISFFLIIFPIALLLVGYLVDIYEGVF